MNSSAYICTNNNDNIHKIMKTTTKHLTAIYSKRVELLEYKWAELISEQRQMTRAEILNVDFQAKKKRVGALYQSITKIIEAPKKEAITTLLKSVHGMNIPQGKLTVNFK